MGFDITAGMLFSDTLVPDIFIKEYLPVLDGESTKIYIYCLFLQGKSECTLDEIQKVFGYDDIMLKNSVNELSNLGLIAVKAKKITVCDIKEKELNKYYAPKTSCESAESTARKSASIRNSVIKHISDSFFLGQMAPSWYGEIDMLYEKYDFDDDVMFMLFRHCADQLHKSGRPLTKAYVSTVANSWFKKGIRTSDDLEKYAAEYEKYKGVKSKVIKKLRMQGNLSVYEEKIIEKWFYEYKYTFDIIELALKKAVVCRNATLATFDRYLTEWFTKGLRTIEQINEYELEKRKEYRESRNKANDKNAAGVAQKNYQDQRTYDDDFFKSLDEEVK